MEDYRNQTEEINLIDMFFYVLKKWRPIFIWGIIGLVIGCGFSFFKMKQMDPKNLDSYFATLEEDEKINKDNITIYKDYMALYDGVIERGEKSVVLNMDPNETYSASLTYYYSSDNNNTIEAFFNSFFDTEDYQTLIDVSGLNCEVRDMREMVSLGYAKTTENNLIVDSAYLTEDQTGKLYVSAIAPTEEILNALVEQLKLMVSQGNKELATQVSGFKTEILSEVSDYGYNGSVAGQQNSFVEERVSFLKNLTTYKDKLSDDEKLYVAYYYPDEDTKLETGFSKKWPVIFAVAFVFVVAVVYVFAFIVSGKVNSEYDIKFIKNLFVIAYIDGKEKKGLDKIFEKWSRSSLPKSCTAEYAAEYINKLIIGKVAICYEGRNVAESSLAKKIQELCKDKVELVANLATESSNLLGTEAADEMIVMINVGTTRKADLSRLYELCKQCGKEVNKAIVIR